MQGVTTIGVLLIVAQTASAQIVPAGSPRSRGFGGGAETLGDDALGVVDNPAALGRPQPFAESIEVGLGFLPEADPDSDEWTWSGRTLQSSLWTRLGYLPTRDPALAFHWALWVDSSSANITARGIVNASEDGYRIRAESVYRQVGVSAGMRVADRVHVGLAIGLGVASATIRREPLTWTEDPHSWTAVSVPALPGWRIAVEYFPAPVLGLALIIADGPYFLADSDTDGIAIERLSVHHVAGRPPTQVVLSGTWEAFPAMHVTASNEVRIPHWPDFLADPIPDVLTQFSVGIEYIQVWAGDRLQTAWRGGFYASNWGGGIWNANAPVYQQLQTGWTLGVGARIKDLSINLSLGLEFSSNKIRFPLGQLAFSLGWILG